ncbi:MAG: response regulator [Calditrichaeota bacterium]|nr:response regulator [Calditrichota bacterium]
MAQAKTILIVDDDAQNIEILVRELVSHHFQVSTAENGYDALEKADKYQPDLIITDADLPDLNGVALLRNLRENEKTATIPVIFLTAQDGLQDRVKAFELGVQDYMIKPLHVAEIVARVKMILSRLQRLETGGSDSEARSHGELKDKIVAELIARLGALRWSGIVNVTNEFKKSGQIFFRNGVVVNAILGGFRGERAVYQMFPWSKGQYSLVPQQVDVADEISISNLGLLLQGYERLQQRRDLLRKLPGAYTVFSVKAHFLKHLEERPVTPDVTKFVELFDGKRPVLKVLDDSYNDDLTTLKRIVKMYQQGFLEEIKTPEPEDVPVEEEIQEPLFSEEEFESFQKRVFKQMPLEEPYLAVLGTSESGKSEFVRALVGKAYRTRSMKTVFPYPLDLGKLSLFDDKRILLVGIPIEKQVRAIIQSVAGSLLGYIFLVNATEAESLDYINYLIKSFRGRFQLPYAVAVTDLRHPKALGIEEISQRLGLESYEEIIPCDPKDRENAKMILLNMYPPYPEEEKISFSLGEKRITN